MRFWLCILPHKISIHALREEGDLPVLLQSFGDIRISIHALREEGDATRCTMV